MAFDLTRCRSRLLSAATLACTIVVPACSGDRGPSSPDVSLAGASGAQSEFRALRARFFDADGRGRAELREQLGGFLSRFPGDERADDVRVYLAFAELERGDRRTARATLAPVLA